MITHRAPRAMIYVQHLLGIGHMARSLRIAKGLRDRGVEVLFVQGGSETGLTPVAGVEVLQLTPVRTDADAMKILLHEDGRPFTPTDQAARRDALLAGFVAFKPDILVIEAFPFGRRQLRFELIPLLEAARPAGVRVIACSVRDVLRDKRTPGRAEETVEVITTYFDRVLVHGIEALTPLAQTFPLASQFADKTFYTGLVGPEVRRDSTLPRHDVVVSIGGGAFGGELVDVAIQTASLPAFRTQSWLVLAGQNLPQAEYDRLAALCAANAPGVDFRRSVPDLCNTLGGAGVSVSKAGYNTVADVLVSGCRAVLVPYLTPKEIEQHDRAVALAATGRVVHLSEQDLSPEALGQAIIEASKLPQPEQARLDGAGKTADLLLEALNDALSTDGPGTSPVIRTGRRDASFRDE